MSEKRIIDLYGLLPELYRLKDAEQGYKLSFFLDIIADQAEIIKRDIDGLWDDFFIETCADWVVPYIGDLVANNPMHEVAQRRRVDVAKTIYYRRRKGTLPMLEELARDVTGWGAHALTFFELLGWTQNLNHLRYEMAPNLEGRNPNVVDRVGTVNLRNPNALDLLCGPFDRTSHTADVRSIDQTEGWYNIFKVGIFLWRLGNYPVGVTGDEDKPDDLVQTCRSSAHPHGYHFSPLGNPTPLFNRQQPELDERGLAGEVNVPGPIRPLALYFDLKRHFEDSAAKPLDMSDYYGPSRSFYIVKDDTPIQPSEIRCMNLCNWDRPPEKMVAVDVQLGRITFAPDEDPKEGVFVYYNYGFSADLGGGPYERRDTLANSELAELEITVSKYGVTEDSVPTIQRALDNWANGGKPNCIITIADNATYEESISVDLSAGKWLVIQAANQRRPTLMLAGSGILEIGGQPGAGFNLGGLLIEGAIRADENVEELNILHSTLVPGRSLNEEGLPPESCEPSVIVDENNKQLHLEIDHSIVGALRLPAGATGLTVSDSIIDGCGDGHLAIGSPEGEDKTGPPATLKRTTVFGAVHVKELVLASNVIFTGQVTSDRRQTGCVRFSYVPKGSQTPRRYHCQPDAALARRAEEPNSTMGDDLMENGDDSILKRIVPKFASIHYGDPAYAQLSLKCAEEIRTGAEDRSEMGAFSSLKQPQREANLRIRLEEYLPFGLEAGFVYIT